MITTLADLPDGCPQVIPTGAAKPARYWRLEILELAPGAEFLCTYELETYTGGIPKIAAVRRHGNRFPLRNLRIKSAGKRLQDLYRPEKLVLASQDPQALGLHTEKGKPFKSELSLLIDGKPVTFTAAGENRWQIAAGSGRISWRANPSFSVCFCNCDFPPKTAPQKFRRATLQIRAPRTQLYYMPAYAWSRSPVDTMVPSFNVQTRMASLGPRGRC